MEAPPLRGSTPFSAALCFFGIMKNNQNLPTTRRLVGVSIITAAIMTTVLTIHFKTSEFSWFLVSVMALVWLSMVCLLFIRVNTLKKDGVSFGTPKNTSQAIEQSFQLMGGFKNIIKISLLITGIVVTLVIIKVAL